MSTSITDPSDNLMVLAIPLLKMICVFVFRFVSGLFWFNDITNDIALKLSTFEKVGHSLSLYNTVGSINNDSDRLGGHKTLHRIINREKNGKS